MVFRRNGSNELELSAVYVGETINLAERLRKYLSDKQDGTSRSISKYLDERREQGDVIEFQVMKPLGCSIDRLPVVEFSNMFTRKMLENIALILQDPICCEVLNKNDNPMFRRARKAQKKAKSEGVDYFSSTCFADTNAMLINQMTITIGTGAPKSYPVELMVSEFDILRQPPLEGQFVGLSTEDLLPLSQATNEKNAHVGVLDRVYKMTQLNHDGRFRLEKR